MSISILINKKFALRIANKVKYDLFLTVEVVYRRTSTVRLFGRCASVQASINNSKR